MWFEMGAPPGQSGWGSSLTQGHVKADSGCRRDDRRQTLTPTVSDPVYQALVLSSAMLEARQKTNEQTEARRRAAAAPSGPYARQQVGTSRAYASFLRRD